MSGFGTAPFGTSLFGSGWAGTFRGGFGRGPFGRMPFGKGHVEGGGEDDQAITGVEPVVYGFFFTVPDVERVTTPITDDERIFVSGRIIDEMRVSVMVGGSDG